MTGGQGFCFGYPHRRIELGVLPRLDELPDLSVLENKNGKSRHQRGRSAIEETPSCSRDGAFFSDGHWPWVCFSGGLKDRPDFLSQAKVRAAAGAEP